MSDAVSRVSVEIGGTEIAFETGKLARQASGAVIGLRRGRNGSRHRHRR